MRCADNFHALKLRLGERYGGRSTHELTGCEALVEPDSESHSEALAAEDLSFERAPGLKGTRDAG